MNKAVFSNLKTDGESCFLCGSAATEITSEHVFPKWLQQRHNIWDERLDLLNGTSIPYRSLKIPCCRSCNSGPLARLEEDVASAVREGYSACTDLHSRTWYLWLGKIFFGILRKEVSLDYDRSCPEVGPIVPHEAISFFSNLHTFLQGIRGCHEFADAPPFSVLVCNLHDLGFGRDFWFADNFHYLTAAIRMGEIGVIVSFEDGGINAASFGRYVEDVDGGKLHPVQFNELYAKVLYQTQLMETDLKYLTSQHISGARPMMTDVFWSGQLREWVQKEFSDLLRFYVQPWIQGKEAEILWYVPPDRVPTWMVDSEGGILIKALSEWEGRKET